jgi:hypothetical protein
MLRGLTGESFTRLAAKIPDNSLFGRPHRSFSIQTVCIERLAVGIRNSLLIPVPNSKIAELGHNSGIFGGKAEKCLLISLLLGNSGFIYGFQPAATANLPGTEDDGGGQEGESVVRDRVGN